MPPFQYETELSQLASTYATAVSCDIKDLKIALSGASGSSLIGVGSGGSFTVASLLCNLHESYTGNVSRPSTPLELICNPTLAASSPVFLVSAEGKNPDIVEALLRARLNSARPVHVLTNRSSSPLLECAGTLADVGIHVFELADKDGYLATNSLLLDAVLIARAYGELDRDTNAVPSVLSELSLGRKPVDDWLDRAKPFVSTAAKRGALIVAFSPLLRPVAADLESKLAESALMHCQLADIRSFAHGRHLWLADRPSDVAILALIEPTLEPLWNKMAEMLPTTVPQLTMPFDGSRPRDLLAGLVGAMHLVSFFGNESGRDPARPQVPQFGRDLHYIDLRSLVPAAQTPPDGEERAKYDVLGAHWPTLERRTAVRRSLREFVECLSRRRFRALVFDYDGTLCSTHRNDIPPSDLVITHIRRLLDAGIVVGIASGRGGSVQEHLRTALAASYWSKVCLGLYNAGWIGDLAAETPKAGETSEFLSHVTRIVRGLQLVGVPIETIRPTHPHQVSVRFRDGVQAESTWFVIADALRQAGLDPGTVVRSKHSVDILAPGVNKSHLVARIAQAFSIDPYDILTMGDQGAWPGNDASLLDHRFAVSVDIPSRRLDRGWKLAPSHKRYVDATTWYLERCRDVEDGRFSLALAGNDGGSR
jgi:fructoselysine-6-P-deglycase FrlB-like protein